MSTDLANLGRTIRVGVILLHGVTEVLDVAVVDLLHGISKNFVNDLPGSFLSPEQRAQALDAEFHWVSEAGPTQQSRMTSNISMTVTDSFEMCPSLDIVIIGASFEAEVSEAELAFVRKSYEECCAFITICGGMEAPLKAGILQGKTATAPRFMLEGLRQTAPGTRWVERRWARDGKLWTSGTLLNGLDLMTAFIRATWPSGEGSLVDHTMKSCAWPDRNAEFSDVN